MTNFISPKKIINGLCIFWILCSLNFAKAQLYFPPLTGNIWDTLAPAKLGYCISNIDSLYNYLSVSKSKSFILLKDGKIVLEKYFGTFKRDSLWYWASAGKTLTSLAVGIAQQNGLLKITDRTSKYLDTGWTSLPRNKEDLITIRHQITMTTGLNDAVSDPDCTSPSCLQYQADAGTRWAYHNAPYTLLDKVIEKASGVTLNNFVSTKISALTGIKGLFYKIGSNNVFVSDTRSMARYGLLLQNDAVWNSTVVLKDTTYMKSMTSTSQNINLSYGYLTWLNGKSSFMVPQSQFVFSGFLSPNAPADNFMALGKNGQLINVCKSKGIVWVRMGEDPNMGGLVATNLNDNIWKYINALNCSTGVTNSMEVLSNRIFPNPVHPGETIKLQGVWTTEPIVTTILGEHVSVNPKKTDIGFELETQHLSAGVYTIIWGGFASKILVAN